MVGHNPALTDLINWLGGEKSLRIFRPLAGDLVIDLDRWYDIELSRGRGHCKTIIKPKDID